MMETRSAAAGSTPSRRPAMPTRRPFCSLDSGVRSLRNSAPSRRSVNVIRSPGCALVIAAASAGERTAMPSMATIASPGRMPAFAAGLPGSVSLTIGEPRSARSPSVAMKFDSQSPAFSASSAKRRVAVEPSACVTSRLTLLVPEALSRRQRRSCHEPIASPSSAVTRSPPARPASAAGDVAGGGASSGR